MNAWLKKQINSIRQQRSSRRGGLQGNGGFTLVELIVVLIVLGILVSLAVMGLRGWQDYADFKRNNEAAKSIFQASQIQLTQYGERGQLSELIAAVTDDGKASRAEYILSEQGSLRGSDGELLDVAAESEGTIWENGFTGNIYYLMAEKGDYSFYVNELKGIPSAESRALPARSRRIKALYDMIDPYISDKDMLNAAICIEFDPDPKVALVYSVFYNHRAERFTYEDTGSNELKGGTAPIQNRSRDARREAKTGYYGADTMARGTDTYISRPVISNVRLNNEETLNLSWTTKGDGGRALTKLIYSIDLYGEDAASGKDGTYLMTIVLGKTNEETISVSDGVVKASVLRANADEAEEYVFPVRIQPADNAITLVLDGLDLNADETTDSQTLKQTASIRRLGLKADIIHAVVTGNRTGVYDITIKKKSNSEHQYFGGMTVREDGTTAYTIENARHLSNIRYKEVGYGAEDSTAASNHIYQVSRDISWEYILNKGAVYQNAGQIIPAGGDITPYFFTPILTLRNTSVLESDNGEQRRSLIKFRFDVAHTAAASTCLGLVAENKGTIRNLSMKGVYVNGAVSAADTGTVYAAAAGAFCGVNSGTLDNLITEDSSDGTLSQIRGLQYVGGIVGRSGVIPAGDDSQTYINLTNQANVVGQRYVGGMTGSLETSGGKITVTGCKNYGKVRGTIVDAGAAGSEKEAWFFGGIAGYTGAVGVPAGTAAPDLITLTDCQSSPYYTNAEIDELIEKIKVADSSELVENFVGGIVGYNDVAQIINCNTEQEQAGRSGYVVGKDYVGGIVGYNSSLVSLEGGSNNRNQVHVIGHSFVGGIAGCNGVGELGGDVDSGFYLALANDTGSGAVTERARLNGWINEGLITSTGDYAGGITGYNSATGVIEDSYSNVEYNGSAEALAQVSSQARFAGGVAGYNKGRIVSTTGTTTTVSVVSGKDYVGGVVGCNDTGGEIIRYELEGGYVGGSHFVGGFIGLNMEPGVFSYHIKSNPNKVSGDYFVGGVIGGNLVPIDEKTETLQVSFETDNFLGDLLAEQGAFAGGFIGYNYLLKLKAAEQVTTDADDMHISHVLAAADQLCGDETLAALKGSEEQIDGGEALEAILENCLSSDATASEWYVNKTTRMVITGQGNTASHQTLGSVRGRVFVGGVVGYNQPSTWLEIRNVENITPVEATGYIEMVEAGMTKLHRYSYAGGMIGKVGERVTLDNCSNRDSGEVRAKGTYTGGLAEINYGTIKNCTAGNIGDGTANYVGGIVGVNADSTRGADSAGGNTIVSGRGLLTDCSVGGQVSGVSYVGGLAAENYGIIRYTEGSSAGDSGTEAVVDASGQYAGGVVGYAHDGGQIIIDGNVTLNINVIGTAQYVGGIAGVNAGIIRVAEESKNYIIENTDENTIIGRNYVGGFIGMQLEPSDDSDTKVTLRRFENHAQVQSSYGYAGGIAALVQKSVGNNAGEKTSANGRNDRVILERCKNFGTVEVLSGEETDDEEVILPDDGNIDEESPDINDGYIPDTDDDGVPAAGGITAVNYGIIRLCGNYGSVAANSGYMGGITAINYHQIERSETAASEETVKPDNTVEALELTGDTYVGGIAAINKDGAEINRSAVRSVILHNQSTSESGHIGGIAALNDGLEGKGGTIKDCIVGVDVDLDVLSSQNDTDYSNLRAEAAGSVGMSMSHDTFRRGDSEVLGNTVLLVSYAADVNMGGIAGRNEGSVTGVARSFGGSDYYSVVAADLRFDSDSMNYFGNIGGITGVNGGTVEKYEFSGYVRGSAGDPANTPEYSAAYDLECNKSRIYGYGGITGSNGSDLLTSNTARIERCYIGMAKIQGTGDGSNRTNVGGIAGFNGMGATIKKIAFSQMTGADAVGVNKFFSQTVDTRYAKLDKTTDTRNKWDPPLSVSTKGTVWVNVTNYGHLGGVAGYNRGNISEINWTSDYAGKREIEGSTREGYFPNGIYGHENKYENRPVDVDYTGVLVTSGAGLVGGITGYNHRTGVVSQAVTGKNWLVSATSQQLGNGIGGIIGYNISEQDIVSCDNHATVYKISDDAVGGITGCQENGTSSSWRYYDCKNYGVLYAKNRGGGVIGVWKYKGGTIEQCQNYGKVHSLNSCGGGLVALVEAVSGGETINLTRCENFGEVYTNNNEVSLAGILSYVDDSQASLDIQISECVNTGNMIGNYSGGSLNGRGGILGIVGKKSKVDIRYCRNYGFIREDSRFYGITKGNENTTLEYCFGAANGNTLIGSSLGSWGIQYPLAETAGSVINSYYFVDPNTKGSTVAGNGERLKIEDNIAKVFKTSENIVLDMGGYTTSEIVFQATTDRTRRNSDESYRLCKGTDSKAGLDKHLEVVGNSDRYLAAPVLKAPTLAANGEYMVSWDAIDGARYYVVSCEYLDAKGGSLGLKNSEVYTNSVLVSSSFEAGGVYASGVRVQVQACSGEKLSWMSAAKEIIFGTRLPYPQISWELAELSEKAYRVVLDNREDYVSFVKENMLGGMSETDPDYQTKLQAELEKIDIYTTGIGQDFSAWDGGYKDKGGYILLSAPTSAGLDNKTVTSYADYTGSAGGIEQSVQAIRESQFPHMKDYEQMGNPSTKSEKFANVQIEQTINSTDIGFAGKTAEELSYYMNLINNEADTTWAVYYRSEMMADDPELGVPVAVSVAEQTPIPSTKFEKIGVKLGNFPGDFLDKEKDGINFRYKNVWVRTYPSSMANSVVLQGWKVSEEEYTADELKELRVSDTGELDENGDKLIKVPLLKSRFVLPGYVVVCSGKNSQGESLYSVYYNTLLKEAFKTDEPETKNCLYNGKTYMKYQIFYHAIDLAAAINNVQPTPTAYLNAAYDETLKAWKHGEKYDEADKFVLTWDQAASGGKPAYTGAEPEGNYKNASYRLTLTGLTADGKTTILENEKEISTPDRTEVGCNTYTADSKNWDYINIHAKLTRVGEVNTSGITQKFPSIAELDFPMRRRLSQVKDVKISLKRNEQGVVIKDVLQYDISFNGITEQAETNALSVYRIEARSLDNPTKVKTLDVAVDNVQTGTDGRQSASLDLSSFRKERISITVQSVAKENDTTYRNGLLSPVREMTVPERLLPPQMGMPEGFDKNNMTAVNYAEEQVMSVDDFVTSALILNMKKDGQSAGASQVDYQIALELYETEKDAKEGKNPVEASEAGLPGRSDDNKVTMVYSTASGEYTYTIQNLPITYAGKWVRVVLRSLGASSISSVWTDEKDPGYAGIDGEIPEVEPCMVFKLPSVQVDTVEFRELDDTEAWEKGIYTVYEDGVEVKDDTTGETMTVDAVQRWVWFDMVDYADDYQIVMVQTPQQADKKALITENKPFWQVSDVNWITLEKVSNDAADKTYSLTYQTTEGADAGALTKETKTISMDKPEITIPYLENIRILSDRSFYIQSEARVRLEINEDTQTVSVGILLPDCQLENESQPILYQRTEQILVQSLARAQDVGVQDAYRDSKWALVSWSDEKLTQSAEPIEQTEKSITPKSVSSAVLEEKTISDILYTLGLEGDTRYLVKVTVGSSELGIFGVPRYSEVTIGQSSQSVWFPMGFKRYAGNDVKLEFLSIFNVSSGGKGGISQKFTEPYTVSLPNLTAQADEPVITSRMAEPKQYRIDITENAGLWKRLRSNVSDTCVLTAAQKMLTWDYDLSDTTVAGYELAVGGSQMEADFRERIDLHRGFFGAMPGVREYLEPDGKLLYTVNYHVNGELVLDLNREYPLASESNAVTVPDSDTGTATASNTNRATASNSNTATASNSTGEPNVLTLECRLRAEYIQEEEECSIIRFTLMLPDLSFDWMQEEAVALYQEAFDEGLYQTETFRLIPVMTDRCYEASEVLLDLTEMRGDLQE